MWKYTFAILLMAATSMVFAQKKPLDHTVYDDWQSIGRKSISADGHWVAYNIDVQEGDSELVIHEIAGSKKYSVPRGSNAVILPDNRYVVFAIKPLYKEVREAKIKKKKADEMPKDSLGIMDLQNGSIWKRELVKSFKTAEENSGWIAYHLAKNPDSAKSDKKASSKVTDSLTRVIDSLEQVILKASASGKKKRNRNQDTVDGMDFLLAPDEPSASKNTNTPLVLRHLATGEEIRFDRTASYVFSKNGSRILLEQGRDEKDSLSKPLILLVDLTSRKTDTITRGGNSFKQFALSESGDQVAFTAEREAGPKDLQKFYSLWYFKDGMDSAIAIATRRSQGVPEGQSISENGRVYFSKSGNRLFFGVAEIQPPKDTNLIEMDQVKLDIWHYQDDYLQTIQLSRLSSDLSRNYLAVYDIKNKQIRTLASEKLPTVYSTQEGDGASFIGVTDYGRRTESQWTGNTRNNIYRINPATGAQQRIKENLNGAVSPAFASPSGQYIVWYDADEKNYFLNDGKETRNITKSIPVKLYAEDHDQPSDPYPYGVMGWLDEDHALLIYDRYDIWQIDPSGAKKPVNITDGMGRKNEITYRYMRTDMEEKFIDSQKQNILSTFSNTTKTAGFTFFTNGKITLPAPAILTNQKASFSSPIKAKDANTYVYTRESYTQSPDLYAFTPDGTEHRLSAINPQQEKYNWGTAELYHWKAFNGKKATGILYKPEDFDPGKKYPVILYFYEKLSDGLYQYHPPSPTPSRLNISFFVSRGYLVFAPDIEYEIGYPARSAYNYIVSAAKDLQKKPWTDAKNMGIQGQSWGGIQVAQLITMTDMFKAAWSGAPVANMTSAYGGIRWQTGMNRQFQYEKTQSRIGATLWEKPQLYIENSPLFHLPKVQTPIVIMANDADGAVPWYQGIELFTGLVRLGKSAWLLNYNGEAHNLVERKNRKDIQIREQQFFDWLLKGDKPAKWLTEGVPATQKGKSYGLELID